MDTNDMDNMDMDMAMEEYVRECTEEEKRQHERIDAITKLIIDHGFMSDQAVVRGISHPINNHNSIEGIHINTDQFLNYIIANYDLVVESSIANGYIELIDGINYTYFFSGFDND